MGEKRKIQEELKGLEASQLRAQQGQVPKWEMPPDYLDQLTDRVLETTAQPRARYRRMVVMRWAAAAVLVLAAGYWWFQTPSVDSSPYLAEVDLEVIPTEDIQQYVSDNIEEFDLDMLATTVVEDTKPGEANTVQPSDAISTEALEEFLEADDEWLDDLTEEDWF